MDTIVNEVKVKFCRLLNIEKILKEIQDAIFENIFKSNDDKN